MSSPAGTSSGGPRRLDAGVRRCHSAAFPLSRNCAAQLFTSRVTPRAGPRARVIPTAPDAVLLAGQLPPGTAAPHAGRALRHDVRPRARGRVTDLDQDPPALPGPGQCVTAG